MREDYLKRSPYNLVRVILGKPEDTDNETNNVYTRAASYFEEWIRNGILARDAEPGFYPYFQTFVDPDTGETLTRKGLIALGEVVDYGAGIVHRHEQTLSGPKKDRLAVLRHTKAHFGQIFMLYEDSTAQVDRILDHAAAQAPVGDVQDEYGVVHRLWRIAEPDLIDQVRRAMADKKLIIADGHHRYETALQYRDENNRPDARFVMMTLVNMCSPGLRILSTHRVLRDVPGLDRAKIVAGVSGLGELSLEHPRDFKRSLGKREDGKIVLGVALPGEEKIHVLRATRNPGDLDVRFLHQKVFAERYGITDEAVREQSFIEYVRGVDTAIDAAYWGRAQAAFLLQPTQIEEVSAVSLGGGVMPQKSTDFYPKLLTGMTIYKLER